MPYRIYDDDGPMLSVTVDGFKVFGCTLEYVQADKREWYAQHIEDAFSRQFESAFNKGRRDAQRDIRAAIGLQS